MGDHQAVLIDITLLVDTVIFNQMWPALDCISVVLGWESLTNHGKEAAEYVGPDNQ